MNHFSQKIINVCRMQIIWKNGSFRKRKNLHYQKIADLVLLSLFMRTNESATILMPPSTGLSGILLSPESNVHEGPEYKKNINTISMHREKPTPHNTAIAVLTSK